MREGRLCISKSFANGVKDCGTAVSDCDKFMGGLVRILCDTELVLII